MDEEYFNMKSEMNDESSTKTISSTTIIKDDVKLKELKRKQKNKKYKFTVDSESGFAAILAFVDCEIPIDDKVLPMVAPGASINDMMGFIDNEEKWNNSFSWHR